MDGIVCRNFSFFRRKVKLKILVFAWIFGLLIGAVFSVSADKLLFSTMRGAILSSMSITGPVTVVLLPLLLSAYAVYFSQPAMLVLVVFLKAFLFAYTGAGLLMLYPVSGWLLRWLLMFSDTMVMPILWLIWLSDSTEGSAFKVRRIAICMAGAMLISCVDLFQIAPFLSRLYK